MKIKIEIDTFRNDFQKNDTEYFKDLIEKAIQEAIKLENNDNTVDK